MRFDSLDAALLYELNDLYSGERQLLSALPKMASAASSADLKAAFNNHLQETKKQVDRLEEIFSLLGTPPISETCEAMQGLIEEGEEIISASGDPRVKDALLIGAAQRVEHYEMAGYGTARSFAQSLGLSDVADLLQATLDEEGAANKALTAIAQDGWFVAGVNSEARDHSRPASSRI